LAWAAQASQYLEENVGALAVKLTSDDLRRINEAFPYGTASDPRYPEHMMSSVSGKTKSDY